MNKKGNVVAFITLIFVEIALWIFMLGPYVVSAAQEEITRDGLTGLQAFLLANLNIAFIVFLILQVVGYAEWEKSQGKRYW
jgi:hypothetical protein